MKTTLHYSTFMTLYVYVRGMTATVDMGCKPLNEVLDFVQDIFNDSTFFHSDAVEQVCVIDSKTGELIAECAPNNEQFFENDDNDWGYNEDMGYDPYLGCYSDDC